MGLAISNNDVTAEKVGDYISNLGKSYESYRSIIIDYGLSGSVLSVFKDDTDINSCLEDVGITIPEHRDMLKSHLKKHLSLRNENLVSNSISPLHFDKRGVRLQAIQEFITECGGVEALENLTTKEVCEQFLKLKTLNTASSYCEYLYQKKSANVGEANVFISHAWQFVFLDVVSALNYHFRNEDKTQVVVWLDLFSNNQHQAPTLDFDWWSTVFKSAIAYFGRTVLILAPWHNPIPLTRVWCLFEIYCSVESKSRFEVAMSETEQAKFLSTIKADYDAVNRMIATVDVANSESTSQSDKEKIFEVVRSTVGFNTINSMIFEQLREWIVTTVKKAVMEAEIVGNEDDILILKEALAEIYRSHGKYTDADALYVECLEKRKSNLVENFSKVLSTRQILAAMYVHQGKYEKAEPHCLASLQAYLDRFGPTHADTIRSMASLAHVYSEQGFYDKAENLYSEALSASQTTFGEDHPNTLWCLNNVAIVRRNRMRFDEAEKLYLKCFEACKSKLGEDHPNTLTMMNNLAALYNDSGENEKAKSLYELCLEKQKIKLGVSHPSTWTTSHNLSLVYSALGDHTSAESLIRSVLNSQSKSLGETHDDTLSSMSTLASICSDQCNYAEAEDIYKKCLHFKQTKLGIDHIKTLETMNNLAVLYHMLGRSSESHELLLSCLRRGSLRLGESHPHVQNWKKNLEELEDVMTENSQLSGVDQTFQTSVL